MVGMCAVIILLDICKSSQHNLCHNYRLNTHMKTLEISKWNYGNHYTLLYKWVRFGIKSNNMKKKHGKVNWHIFL